MNILQSAVFASKKAARFIGKHAPTILMIFGTGGLVSSIGFAIAATPKAVQLLDERKEKENKEKLTKLETIETVWKPYLPTIGMAALSLTCFFGAHGINLKRQAALVGLWSASRKELEEYQAKVVEKFGKKEEQEVRNDIAADYLKNHPIDEAKLILTGYGDTIFIDELSGQQFVCSIPKINEIQAEINQMIAGDMYISKNEFYELIGLRPVADGDEVGWTVDYPLFLEWDIADKTRMIMLLKYREYPKYNFNRLDM